jgi:hypothetical protein
MVPKLSISIMEGEESLRRFSPEVIVQDPNLKKAVSLLPPIVLFHGTADYSIPADSRSDSYLKKLCFAYTLSLSLSLISLYFVYYSQGLQRHDVLSSPFKLKLFFFPCLEILKSCHLRHKLQAFLLVSL